MTALKWSVYYITCVIGAILTNLIFSKLSGEKYKLKLIPILTILIMSGATLVNNYFLSSSMRILNAFIFMVTMNYFVFNVKFVKSIYYSTVIMFATVVIEIILMLFLPNIDVINLDYINNSWFLKILFSLVIQLVAYLLLSRKVSTKAINQFEERFLSDIRYEVFFFFIIIVFSAFSEINSVNFEDLSTTAISLSLAVIVLTFSVIILNINKDAKFAQNRTEELLESMKKHEIIAEDYRTLKHNMINDLLGIKAVSSKENQEHIDFIIKKYQKDYAWISKISAVPYGIKGLIHLKLSSVDKLKIDYTVECNVNENYFIKMKRSKYTILCDIIGIYIDNAIYAAKNSESKTVYVSITNVDNKVCINIVNSFNNSIDAEKIGTKNYSTKKRKSGIGLAFARKRARKIFKVTRTIVNDIFITKIFI